MSKKFISKKCLNSGPIFWLNINFPKVNLLNILESSSELWSPIDLDLIFALDSNNSSFAQENEE